jgi:Rieske Fe-S protein
MCAKRFEEPVKRRDFLGIMALGSCAVTMVTSLVGMLRLPSPAVLPESASRVKVGFPDDVPVDTHRMLEKQKAWLFRDALGFYAMSAICSHLGCIVREEASGRGYMCPCHGSGFDEQGRVLSGPAPRGLDWLEISLAADGRLMVDTAKTVPPGTRFTV